MPLVHIHITEGKTDQQKRALMLAVTEAVESSIDANRSTIRVFLHELPKSHVMVAGVRPGEVAPPKVGNAE